MAIGDRIKEIRNRIGMSQVEFADKINVSKQTLYKYENNIITNIPSDKIEAAAELGHVSPAYLMGWSDSPYGRGKYNVYVNVEASSKEDAIYNAVKNMMEMQGQNELAEKLTQAEAVNLYEACGFNVVIEAEEPTTLAAHFDGDEYTEDELEEIKQFAEFVKNRKNKVQ